MFQSKIIGVLFLFFISCGSAYPQLVFSDTECIQSNFVHRTDYRDRSTGQLRWNIEDNKKNHMDPARLRIESGEYSRSVISDIDFTLVRYPNHPVALNMLVNYSLSGGKRYEFAHFECYFKWAREFAPDDTAVLMAEAFYFWRTKKINEAILDYQEAIKIDSRFAAAYYNLGLLYFEQEKYQEALNYASSAYEFGYPLQGLREKLAAFGFQIVKAEE